MTTIGMHYDVIPGKEDEFEKGFIGVLELLKTLPGHTESHMYEDIQSKGSYVIFSQWETKEAFEKFLQSPEFKGAVAWGKAEILRSRPRHKVILRKFEERKSKQRIKNEIPRSKFETKRTLWLRGICFVI